MLLHTIDNLLTHSDMILIIPRDLRVIYLTQQLRVITLDVDIHYLTCHGSLLIRHKDLRESIEVLGIECFLFLLSTYSAENIILSLFSNIRNDLIIGRSTKDIQRNIIRIQGDVYFPNKRRCQLLRSRFRNDDRVLGSILGRVKHSEEVLTIHTITEIIECFRSMDDSSLIEYISSM